MTHIEQRLAERNITIATEALWNIARKVGKVSSAVLLGRVAHQGQQNGAYRSRSESNGDLVILLVRGARPVTIMYRRSNQPFTAEALHVNQVIELQ